MSSTNAKVLFTASIAKHFIRFHQPYMEWFKDQGYEVHAACNGEEEIPFCDKKWEVPFIRNPYSAGHLNAYRELKKIIGRENYDIIHCHTPMASIITRIASNGARKNGTSVLYTAHGFHFYKGSSLFNWLTYFPIELAMSRFTDGLVTINREDFELIHKKGYKKTDYFQIPGIGVEPQRFHPVNEIEKNEIRRKNDYGNGDFILTYAAEFINRKNHEFIIQCGRELVREIPNIKILFAGRGELKDKLEAKSNRLELDNHIHFLGFRTDIDEVFKMSDVGISASKQEGLPINLVEVMMCGLPVIATVERGHKELIDHGENGCLFNQNNKSEFVDCVKRIYSNEGLRKKMAVRALYKSKMFGIKNAKEAMTEIYSKYMSKNL